MQTTNRINGHDRPTNGKAKAKPRKRSTPKAKTGDRSTIVWAWAGVAIMAIMSALLNGYANASHGPLPLAGWGMGIATPVLVLILAKVAGNKWHAGQQHMAYLAGGSGAGLLALSVWHCSLSIATITASPLLLALPMAIAIDMGLVACEMAIITERK